MKPHKAALDTLLATRQFVTADLFKFSLVGGGELLYCSGDQDLTVVNDNYLLQTDNLSISPWATTNGSVTHFPGGEPSADAFTETAANAEHYVSQPVTKAASAQPFLLIVDLKGGLRSRVALTLTDNAGNGIRGQVNLSTGAVISLAAFGAGWTATAHGVAYRTADGYTRYYIRGTTNSATALHARLNSVDGAGSISYAGTAGTVAFYARKPMLVNDTAVPALYEPNRTSRSYTYEAGDVENGPFIVRDGERVMVNWRVGVEVDSIEFVVIPGTATVLGVKFLTAVRRGFFDGAEFSLSRAYMATYGDTSAGLVLMFLGRVGEVSPDRSSAHFTCNSHLELLNIPMPRSLWQPGCINNLGDAPCGVSLAAFGVNTTALAGSTSSVINSGAVNPAGYFDQGKILFTTGANAGISRSVRRWTGGQFTLFSPLPVAPSPADAFTAYPGCDKTTGAGGCAKFSNLLRYRGFPFVPQPETAI